MRTFILTLAMAGIAALSVQQALAHGDEPHPKCKKGYVLSDEHKCVKKG